MVQRLGMERARIGQHDGGRVVMGDFGVRQFDVDTVAPALPSASATFRTAAAISGSMSSK